MSDAGQDGDLSRVREELRRRGYLAHRFERFLLQDAAKAESSPAVVAAIALKVGLLAGAMLAAAGGLSLALANASGADAARDFAPLVAHLLAPSIAISALAFLAAAGALSLVLRVARPRRIEVASRSIALAVVAGSAFATLWPLGAAIATLPRAGRAATALAVPVVIVVLWIVLSDGLLALAVRRTRIVPERRRISRRALAIGIAAAAVALGAPALFAPEPFVQPAPTSIPQAPGDAVAVVGVDGILASEVDYLLARGDLPNLSAALARGGVEARYPRDPVEAPAAFWTTIATGRDPAVHGVTAVDSFRPLGAATSLARTGPWRIFFERFETPLGLAEHRPLLARRRRVPAFWELVARGGAPVAAIGWWTTYPAEPLPGIVVAHGAYTLLAAGADGVVAPASRLAEVREAARRVDDGGMGAPLTFTLGAEHAKSILERAILPDRFALALAKRETASEARALALYLPALDIAAENWTGGDLALADLARRELADLDMLLADLAERFGTIVLVVDPGRRGGREGRAFLIRRGCAARERASIAPAEIAAALLRAAGLAQSDELPPPPAICNWPEPPARVATYGELAGESGPTKTSDEYLKSLRSLGYL